MNHSEFRFCLFVYDRQLHRPLVRVIYLIFKRKEKVAYLPWFHLTKCGQQILQVNIQIDVNMF